jgi:hypothetical protein
MDRRPLDCRRSGHIEEPEMKDYLGYENARNKAHAGLYVAIMRAAFGADCEVLIGHHLTFEQGGKLETENEIPSADCLMFDHEVMKRVFGSNAFNIMRALASVPAEKRDSVLQTEFDAIQVKAVAA